MSVINPAARDWLTIPAARDWLTIKEAADSLGVSRDLIRSMIRRGELDARKFGRIIRIRAVSLKEAGKPLAVGGAR